MAAILRQLSLYFTAQQFLTRLPIPAWVGYEDGALARASRYFPLVGFIVGAIAAAVWALAPLPAPLAAGLALAVMILVTGALHEDGLADCCDGLGGGATRERALEIMRDSRIGAYGAVGLILSIGLRWAALAGMTLEQGVAALIIAPMAGRAAITLMLWRGVYARPDGAARDVSGGASAIEFSIAFCLALVAALALGGAEGALAAFLALFAAALWLTRLTKRLGGYTGDGLGAAEQIGQIVVLLVLAGLWT